MYTKFPFKHVFREPLKPLIFVRTFFNALLPQVST
jgi:hypothetical protein